MTKTDSTGTTTYTWDVENRLTSVQLPGSGGTVSFGYDPLGRRVYKVAPGGTTNYLYDGANILENPIYGFTTTAAAVYTQAPGIDEPLAVTQGGVTSYYQADGLGSVTSLTDATGTVAATYTYDTFGNLTASSGTLTNPFRYTGREFDAETGLYYYRARYYDAAAGRFLSEDQLAFGGGMNFYAYVSSSPTNLVDPLGLQSSCSTKQCIPQSYLPMSALLSLKLMSKASKLTGVTYFFGIQGSVAKTKIAGLSYGFSGVWATDPQGHIALVYSLTGAATIGTPGASIGVQVGAATYNNFYNGFPGASYGREASGGQGLNVGGGYASNSSGVATFANVGFASGKSIDVNTHAVSTGVLIIPLCP